MKSYSDIYLFIILLMSSLFIAYVMNFEFPHQEVDIVNFNTIDGINEELCKNGVYFVKVYKDEIGEKRYKFNHIKIDTFVEKNFKNINRCKYYRYSRYNEDFGVVKYKIRNQYLYQNVYTTIPKEGMYVQVYDKLFFIKIIDKNKLSNLLGINNNLTLKPIEYRIWLNVNNKELNEEKIKNINKDLKDVGLKIIEYKKL